MAISRAMLLLKRISEIFSLNKALSERRNLTTHTALTIWEMTVAMAAPTTPQFKTNIKIGSRMMFSMAPMAVVIIPILGKPWALM